MHEFNVRVWVFDSEDHRLIRFVLPNWCCDCFITDIIASCGADIITSNMFVAR